MGLTLTHLSFTYQGASSKALDDVCLDLQPGRFYGIVGTNGAGKSTLCNIFSGLIPHFLKGSLDGEVTLDGQPTSAIPIDEMAMRVGYVFQNPFDQLSHITYRVDDEVAFGLQNLGVPRDEIVARVTRALEVVRLADLRDRYPLHLSGGQLQRLAVAAVLAMSPDIVVMDEPTSQLDPQGTREVFQAVADLRASGVTVVLVEHKVELLAAHVDELIALGDGRVVCQGSPRAVFASPVFTDLGVNQPQMAELALQLGFTGEPPALPLTPSELISHYGLEALHAD